MPEKYKLHATPQRMISFFSKSDPVVPTELFSSNISKPNLDNIMIPLPSRKKDYFCSCTGGNGALWIGSRYGLTRINESSEYTEDRVMYFSKERYLADNNLLNIISDNINGVWVLTENGVVHITMSKMSVREKADLLLSETLKIVDRRGMVSQKFLAVPGDLTSYLPYGHSDNDGGFTALFATAEILHYAVLERERCDREKLKSVFETAVRAVEACLLLMYISKRGDGFVARSYLTEDEPVPDDGLFYRLQGNTAVCLNTCSARKRNIAGLVIDASSPIPERLRKLYVDLGYDDDGLVYKGDTSSDEITHHYVMLYWAHKVLGKIDHELDELIIDRANAILTHIVKNNYSLMECNGKPTTWAKWSTDYFNTVDGWTDACLNSAELLMYVKVTQAITGETSKWQKEYDKLISLGYATLPSKHYDRAFQTSLAAGYDIHGELMYGDNMLSVLSFWPLIMLEEDEDLRKTYIEAFKTWNGTLCREDTPGYIYPYALCCGIDGLDMNRSGHWFERFNVSRLAAGVSLNDRFDIAKRIRYGNYEETSILLQPDERFIAKFDRNPWKWCEEDSGGTLCVESCYVFTFSYWFGLYYGFLED